MSPQFSRWWQRVQVKSAHLSAGGSWAAQLSSNTQTNLRSFFFDGLFASASDSIILTYLTLFFLFLGASNADIGLMTALGSISATVLLIPGAVLVDRVRQRKKIVLIASKYISKALLVLLALLPFVTKGKSAIIFAIGLKVLMDGLQNFALPAWVSLSADIVPLSWRGSYFGTRNLAMNIASLFVIYAVGQMITILGEPAGYQWSMGLAFLFGLFSAFFFARLRDYQTENTLIQTQSYSIKSLINTLHVDHKFLSFCIFTAVWTFSLNIAGPFFNVFLAKDLTATAGMVGVISVVGKFSSLPSQKYLGVLTDRWGPHRMIQLMAFSIPLLPISWFFIQSSWQAIPINIVGGILWAGMNLASFNFLLEIAPQDQRARYSAMYQIAVAFSSAAGASIGGVIADGLGIRYIFLISGVGRFIAAFIFLKLVHQITEKSFTLVNER